MIKCYAGTPGSGKTYEAVKTILDYLRCGKAVYTNIDGLDVQECRECIKNYCGLDYYELSTRLHFLSREESFEFWKHAPPGSLIVLDEVHKFFSNRDWNTEKNRQFTEWASTHRHEGYDVVLITQDVGKIDSHARSLIEWTDHFRKVNFFGGAVQKKYLCYSYAGDDTSGQPLCKSVRTYDSRVFRCYQSYTSKDIKEMGLLKQANILKHPVFYALPVVVCVALYMFFAKSSFATGDVLGSKAVMARLEEKKSAPAPPPQPVSVAAPTPAVAAAPAQNEIPKAEKTEKEEPKEPPKKRVRIYRLPDGGIGISNIASLLPPE